MKSFRIAAAAAGVFACVAAAEAQVIDQRVEARANPDSEPIVFDNDFISGVTSTDINREILAEAIDPTPGMFGPEYTIRSAAGRFGEIGLSGSAFTAGDYMASVGIVHRKLLGAGAIPTEAFANFVIDGGMFDLIAPAGSFIDFRLRLGADIYDLATGPTGARTVFESTARLTATSGASWTFETFGDDIGAAQAMPLFKAEIPLSFQSVSLGKVGADQAVGLIYEAEMWMNLTGTPEIASFGFSDPLTVFTDPTGGVGGGPDWLTVDFRPVAAVPVPAAAPMLLAALAGLAALARRRSAKV
jgi:hypothetical protein